MNPQKKMVYVQRILNPSHARSTGLGPFNKDNFLRVMSESIEKALNPTEAPLKEKHVRRILIGTHQAESALFFWNNLHVTRLKENQLICWKFCHLLHKMLRDGPRQVLSNCHDRRQILLDCGNMWRHVDDGYGQLIYKYCNLLYNRINFLARNSYFPNDLKLDDEQLNELGRSDLGVFFQLSCEMFDALDDILALQECVFASMESKKLNSMTNAGRCLLAPLVVCIQDSSTFYDYIVKILFKLHASLPPSTLEGHRERFTLQHEALKSFFTNTSNLQYFKTLIQISHLYKPPPNFLIASELNQHVTPKVIMIAELERESPDHISESADTSNQQLVNLAEDAQYEESTQLPAQSLMSSSTSFNRSLNSILDQPDSSQVDTCQQSKTESDLKCKIEELEETMNNLKLDLETEKSDHKLMRQTLESAIDSIKSESADKINSSELQAKKLREDISKLNHIVKVTQTSLKEVQEERDRAVHDSEINKEAMKKMVKDLSELKSQKVNPQAPMIDSKNTLLIEELQLKIKTLSDKLEECLTQKRELEKEKEVLLETKARLQRQLENQQEDLLTAEMDETDKILKEATKRIEELSEKSRRLETGVKLQVNEKIAEVCSNLMKTVRNLIIQSRLLQREIVGDSGLANIADFYMRNSSWTEGLISAANVVAMAAKSLVNSADMAMSGRAKFSELAAAAHEVAAATTQLVVASRVKANKDSEKLKLLTGVAKQVNQCTNNIVDTARVCAQLIEQEIDKVDISSLTLHQTKKLEMETQVKLLELEDQLSKERIKLGVLRRQHYEQEDAQADRIG